MIRSRGKSSESIDDYYMYCFSLSLIKTETTSENWSIFSKQYVSVYPNRLAEYGLTLTYNITSGFYHLFTPTISIDTSQYAIISSGTTTTTTTTLQLPVYILQDIKNAIEHSKDSILTSSSSFATYNKE